MRVFIIIAMALIAATLVWWKALPESRSDETPPSHSPPPTATHTNPTEIFEKAFWRRPTAEDHILNAERREWSDANGLQKWQWFIAVRPSPGLVKHLREDNVFGLVPTDFVPRHVGDPSWFNFESKTADVLRAPRGDMRLIFNKADQTLLATASGTGFRPGAPEPQNVIPSEKTVRRLPTTPPPDPSGN
jgi:hypothetical protein